LDPLHKPAFSAIGFMPVLPGPCGLFRYHEIKGGAIDRYFNFVQRDVEEMGMVEGNLTIAEDRILSLEACIHNNSGNKVGGLSVYTAYMYILHTCRTI
jgi:hypothetical protein